MTINDLFHVYAMKHGTETAGMLQDYPLDSRLDRDALNGMILLELGDRVPYYNETTVLKYAIDNWFATHNKNITRLVDAISIEYDPLRPKEEWEDTAEDLNKNETVNKEIEKVREFDTDETKEYNSSETNTHNTTDKITHNTTNTTTYNSTNTITADDAVRETTGNTDTNEISAYNSSGYQPQAKVTSSGTDTSIVTKQDSDTKTGSDTNKITGTETDEKTGSDTLARAGEDTNKNRGTITETESGVDKEAQASEQNQINRHLWGRDVESIADLIEDELKLAKWNIYEWIVNNLGEKICLGIF